MAMIPFLDIDDTGCEPMNAVYLPRRTTPAPCLGVVAGLCVSFMLLGGCHKAPVDASAPAASEAKAELRAAEEDTGEGVSLKSEEVEKLGISTTEAKSATHIPEVAGYGVIVPHETLAQSVSELVTAAAAENQSRAALARIQHLAGTPGAMAADALETAVRQDTVDRAALSLARQRSSASFGQNPPWKDDLNSATLNALANGEIKLVRVTLPFGSLGDKSPATLRLARINGGRPGKSWKSTTLWDAPADANIPGKSFFGLLKGGDAGEGERVLAWAPVGDAEAGVEVPAAAAVISAGKYWCYVEDKPGHFVRVELDTSMPVVDGYFVKEGIAAGDKVVTTAAGLLLARETNPSAAAD
jgi:hypothetical protein